MSLSPKIQDFFNILLKPNLLDQICKAFVLFLFSYTYFCSSGILETTKSVALTKCLVISIFPLLPQFSSMCVFQGGKSRGSCHFVKRALKVVDNVAFFTLKKGCYLLLCRHTQTFSYVFLSNLNSANVFIHVCTLLLRSTHG